MFFLIVILPLIPLLLIIFRLFSWFSFDDQKERVIMPFKQSIAFKKIRTICVAEAAGYLSVCVETGRGRLQRHLLVDALDLKDKQRLEEELGRRFPVRTVHKKLKKRLLRLRPILGVIAVISIFYSIHFVSMGLYRWVKVIPQKMTLGWEKNLLTEGNRYNLGAISFSLPGNFELIQEHERRLVFRGIDRNAKLKVALKLDIAIPDRSWLTKYGTGIRDRYDLLTVAYQARFALAPLALKAEMLKHLDEPAIYKIQDDGLKGFVVRGTRGKIHIAEIMLVDTEKKHEIDFTLSSLEPIDDETLGAIIASVVYEDLKP